MPDTSRFDVVVVGAGPAGLAAALEASAVTSSVAVIDQNPHPGGQIWRPDIHGNQPSAATQYAARDRATFINSATVVDAWTSQGRHWLKVEQSGATLTLETGTIVLATGARELFQPFPGWTLPGVVGVGGLQALMKSGLDVRGKRIVVAGTGPLIVAVAAAAARKGADVVAVVEQAPVGAMLGFLARLMLRPLDAAEAVRLVREIPPGALRLGSWVRSAEGRDRVAAVTLEGNGGRSRVDCDYLACAYGLLPNLELPRLLGCVVSREGVLVDESQQSTVPGIYAAGECTGIAGVNKALAEGLIAGRAAVGLGSDDRVRRWRAAERRWGEALGRAFAMRSEVRRSTAQADTIVCRCEDVRWGDVEELWNPRQAKLYFRAGMGPCQGRVCRPALTNGQDIELARPPIHPATLSSFLGEG